MLFNDSSDYDMLAENQYGFNISFYNNNCTICTDKGAFDDVVRIEDSLATIDGKPYIFQTAIKNRLPVLDYIHEAGPGSTYDIKIMQNDSLKLTPQGYDPDDASIKYYYAGWRQDHDAEFNFSCCQEVDGMLCSNFANCVIQKPMDDYDRTWMGSELFGQSQRSATINTSVNDTGPHVVTISVVDEEGLVDFQNVKILVRDLPQAVPNASNNFPGLWNNITSVEDPYNLNATNSKASMIMNEKISFYFLSYYSLSSFY